ncbi:putative flap endonuclease-1-like 5' DNA nuclease [Sphingomonas sp. F9_3S_D5_B_2]
MDVLTNYWPIVLVALLAVVAVAFLVLRPRQRIQLSDKTPARPHMANVRPAEGRGLAGEAAAATSDITGELLDARVHSQLDEGGDTADDFTRMKGVGPKLADSLHALGFRRFDQLAALTSTEIERLDERLGAFRGRLTRDRVVEQAAYLSRDDIDGYEQTFGKL